MWMMDLGGKEVSKEGDIYSVHDDKPLKEGCSLHDNTSLLPVTAGGTGTGIEVLGATDEGSLLESDLSFGFLSLFLKLTGKVEFEEVE